MCSMWGRGVGVETSPSATLSSSGTPRAASRPTPRTRRACSWPRAPSSSRRPIRSWTRAARSTPQGSGRTLMRFATAASKPHAVNKRRARPRPHGTDQRPSAPAARKGTMEANSAFRWPHRALHRESTRATPHAVHTAPWARRCGSNRHCAPQHRSRSTHRQRVRARAGGHAPRTEQGRRHQRTAHTPHMKAMGAKTRAYARHARHAGGVPARDVLVEARCRFEQLQASRTMSKTRLRTPARY
jgi:hypothetical protein